MQDAPAAQRYLDAISVHSPVVRDLLARGRATGVLIAPFVAERNFKPGEVMIAQGSKPAELMVLIDGHATASATVETDGRMSEPETVSELGPMDVVAEVSTFTGLPAIATLTAKTSVRALGFSAAELGKLSAASPATGLGLLHRFAENLAEKIVRTRHPAEAAAGALEHAGNALPLVVEGTDIIEKLRSIRAFHWADDDVTDAVANLFTVREVVEGEVVMQDGEVSNGLMLLVSGTAMVQVDAATARGFRGGEPHPEYVLLGEAGFLLGRPRAGTITARTHCCLLELPSARFVELAAASPHFAEMLLCGILVAVSRKLVDTSEMRARYEATIDGSWKDWFAGEELFIKRYGAW